MGVYISKVVIIGFKRFQNIKIDFNNKTSILVGDNESGKTTVIQAIDLALNHSMKSFDNTLLANMFNNKNVKIFKDNPRFSTLPEILIQIHFEGMDGDPKYLKYYGATYKGGDIGKERFGIEFKASLSRDYESMLSNQILQGHIPFEYYDLKTTTFANQDYRPGVDNISFCYIDADSINGISSYSKIMFKQLLTSEQQVELKNVFSQEMEQAIGNTMNKLPEGSPSFQHDLLKSSLENLISIYEDNVPLTMKGRGRENFVKIQLALSGKKPLTIIAIEEPENHLSHSTMNKMLKMINEYCGNDVQMIVTSHSSRITSGLGLDNVVMLSKDNEQTLSLKTLSSTDTVSYFKALPSDNLLYFVLSKKVILVEGPSEAIYMNKFCKIIKNGGLNKYSITCIPVNGLSFKHFVQIGNSMSKRIAVITDNDGDLDKVKNFRENLLNLYDDKNLIDVFYDGDIKRRTFEIALYQDNKEYIHNNLPLDESAIYKHDYSGGDKYLGKMLNNKTSSALTLIGNEDFESSISVPEYIKKALEFIIDE